MAWNEPGRGQDPWRGRRSGASSELDDLLRDLQQRLGGMFGGGGDGGNDAKVAFGLIGAFIVLAWLLFGFYQVDDAQRGVVQRFGKFVEVTGPGLHWRVPFPVDTVTKVDVSQVRKYEHKTVMLTMDENVVSIDVEVQYRATDAQAFLFNVRDPEVTLGEVTNSAIREVIGKTGIDQILEGNVRAEIAAAALKLTQTTLDAYGTGIVISTFNLRDVQLPDQVQDAVRDAIKAREDKETQVLAAQAYSNDILPKARGQAARDIQDAEAYRSRVVAQAEGETARFTKLLAEYQKAPGVTRERLYLETLEQVLGANAKVLVNTKGGNNVLYLPLDQLKRAATPPLGPTQGAPATPTAEDSRARDEGRNRGGR
jgi:membrane protease subunit HflK